MIAIHRCLGESLGVETLERAPVVRRFGELMDERVVD